MCLLILRYLKCLANVSIATTAFAILLMIAVVCTPATATQSGIYVDNGVDQTIMHRVLTDDDKLEVSYEILEFLGIADRPSHRNNHQLSLRKSAPKFLLDVYHRISAEEGLGDNQHNEHPPHRSKRDVDEMNEDNFITDLDKRAIDESDIIMTFLNKRNHNVDEMRHEHGARLWFDVSNVPIDNYLMMAELRIYQNSNEGKWLTTNKAFTITVYSIRSVSLGQNKLELEPLSSVNTTGDYVGWLEMNTTEGLSEWLQNSKENHGIYIGAHAVNKPEREVKLDDIGLIHRKVNVDDEYQPFMIGFFRGPELIKATTHSSHRRTKRSTSRKKKKSESVNPLLDSPIENTRSCQMQTLYIDFRDLGWHDWIIAPDGYGAFYCSGECNFPLNAHMNATNHAIVQTLVHLLEPKKVPKPCCAPTRLGALPVLYHLNDENVNLKKYRNMIVKSCGCH
ncbi:protein 60A [Scaptodrosophila lebanonensis]|uniref:Protein 60A n=1 Tax=Drosophila lebanonensis TaxID=7225 RepID=A0A6J2TS52_DROLE|nr:protein 60A [Scaptodrosophila lebanonensis]